MNATIEQEAELEAMLERFNEGARVVFLQDIVDGDTVVAKAGEYGRVFARYQGHLPTIEFGRGQVIDCAPDEIEICARRQTVRA